MIKIPFELAEDKVLLATAKENWNLAKGERGTFDAYKKHVQNKAAGEESVYQITNIFDAAAKIPADNVLGYAPTAYSAPDINESPELVAERDKFNREVLSKFRPIFWNCEYASEIKALSFLHYGILDFNPFAEVLPMELVRWRLKYGKLFQVIISNFFKYQAKDYIHEVYYHRELIGGVYKVIRTNVAKTADGKQVDEKILVDAGMLAPGEFMVTLETSIIPVIPVFYEYLEGEVRNPFQKLTPIIQNLESTLSDQLTLQKKFSRPFLEMDLNTVERMKDPESGVVPLGGLIPKDSQESSAKFITWESEQKARRDSIFDLYREALYTAEIESSSLNLSLGGDLPPSGLAIKRLNRLETRKSSRRKGIWEEVLADFLEGLQQLYTNFKPEAKWLPKRPNVSCMETSDVLLPTEFVNQIVLKVQNNVMSRETAINELFDAGFDAKSELAKIINELPLFGKSANQPANNPTEAAQQQKQEDNQAAVSEGDQPNQVSK